MPGRASGCLIVLLVVALSVGTSEAQGPAKRDVILATTTSTQDSGLLDVLVPTFEKQSGYRVKTIAAGTGQSLAMGARGDADVVLVHAPSLEKKYVAEGTFINRRMVMFNDFVLVGPPSDPAKIKGIRNRVEAFHRLFDKIKGMPRLLAAFRRLAETKSPFVSRADKSGTHILEMTLWEKAGVQPAGPWYIQIGQGMGAALNVASEKGAYTLTDRGTYLAIRRRVQLDTMVEKDPVFRNFYHVMEVNTGKFPKVNAPSPEVARKAREKFGYLLR